MAAPIFTENQISEYRDRTLAGGPHCIKPPPSFIPQSSWWDVINGELEGEQTASEIQEMQRRSAEVRRAAAEAEVAAIREMQQHHWTGVRADEAQDRLTAEINATYQRILLEQQAAASSVPVPTPTPAPVTATPKPIPVPGKRKMVL